jgi:uncharacterized protein (TIGR03437 family)
MAAAFLLLAALLFQSWLWGQESGNTAPSFSSSSIVSSANGSPVSLTPNGLASIYGANLAFVTQAVSLASVGQGALPTTLGGVRVVVGGFFASLLYVSPTQVNFLMPANLQAGSTTITLIRDSAATPPSPVTLLDAAPAVFVVNSLLAAEHADGSLISPDSPANPGEVIVVYCTGLGRTNPRQVDGAVPVAAAPILLMGQLQVLLDGQAQPPGNVLYAGITPGYPGLYQINLRLPNNLTNSPTLQVSLENQMSQSSLQLSVASNGQ